MSLKNDPHYQDDKFHWKIIIIMKMTLIEKSSLLSGLCLLLSVLASPHRQRVNCNSSFQIFWWISFFQFNIFGHSFFSTFYFVCAGCIWMIWPLVLGSGWWGWQESEKDFEEAAGKPEMTMMENLTFIEPLNKDYCIELNCKYFELNHKTLWPFLFPNLLSLFFSIGNYMDNTLAALGGNLETISG